MLEILQQINAISTITFGLLTFALSLALRELRIFAFSAAVLLFICTASLSIMVKLMFPVVNRMLVILLLALITLLIALIARGRDAKKDLVAALVASLGAGLMFAITQIFTRTLGLGSIGFGDGQTILSISLGFQGGLYDKSDWSLALKRGFGVPAVQAFGFDGQYLAGFLPLVLLAALFATYFLLVRLGVRGFVLNATFAVFVLIMLTTEAIARHIYLMNSHTMLWVVFALLLVSFAEYRNGNPLPSTWILPSIALATASLLRADYLLVTIPFLLVLTWLARPESNWRRILFWVASFGPFAAWASVLGLTASPLGKLTFPLFSLVAILSGAVFIIVEQRFNLGEARVLKLLRLSLPVTLVLASALASGTWASLQTIFINFFLGEGLWGVTPLATVLIFAILIVLNRGKSSSIQKWIFGLAMFSISVLIVAKFGDGFSFSGPLGGFARVGWGDSLNRLFVSLTPFVVVLLTLRINQTWERFNKTKIGS
jgi:hypothetical protein